jgi:hypothetical protein
MSEKEEDDPVALAEPSTSNSSMGIGSRPQARRPTRFALEAQARKVSVLGIRGPVVPEKQMICSCTGRQQA